MSSTGMLQIRSDFSSTSINSGVAMGTGWHNVELCGTVGTTSTWNLYRDGVRIVTNWAAEHRHVAGRHASRSATPRPRRSRPTSTTSCWTSSPGTRRPHPIPRARPRRDSHPERAPRRARSSSAGPPRRTPRRRSRTASTATGTRPRSARRPRRHITDPGLTPGSSHTYTVDALDSLSNPSLMSPVSASILVSGGATPPIFSDDFTSGNLLGLDRVHPRDDRQRDRFAGGTERQGAGDGPVRLRLPRSHELDLDRLPEREREPGLGQQRRPVPPAQRRERSDRQGARVHRPACCRSARTSPRRRSTPASRWAPVATTSSSAERSGRPRRGTSTATACGS